VRSIHRTGGQDLWRASRRIPASLTKEFEMTNRRDFLKGVGVAAGAAALGAPAIVRSQQTQRWRVQTLWAALDVPQKLFTDYCENVKKLTNGRLEITPFAAGSVVGAFETLDAVTNNVLQGQSTYPGYWAGKEPALAVIGDFAWGYSEPAQQDRWLREKGGLDMLRKAYGRSNAYTIGCTWWGVESLAMKKPIRRMDDFKGIKHRGAQGIAAETIAKMGASIVVIPGGEAYSALEKGIVDCCDWATLSINQKAGFFEVAKYGTFPGFHSMPVQDFTVNMPAWKALPDDVKAIVEKAWREFSIDQVKHVAADDAKAAAELKQKGIELIAWTPDELTKARALAMTVADEWGKKGPLAKQAVDSQKAYLRELKLLA
jgi:TRAP-type mannitol/chloroaromatic compound transport system substrate-binding protein